MTNSPHEEEEKRKKAEKDFLDRALSIGDALVALQSQIDELEEEISGYYQRTKHLSRYISALYGSDRERFRAIREIRRIDTEAIPALLELRQRAYHMLENAHSTSSVYEH